MSDEAALRRARVHRTTHETDVTVGLNLEGTGTFSGGTGVAFFDHMLAQVAKHALFDLEVRAKGDLDVDVHHTVEDIGIVLGGALDRALGDRSGIVRFGSALVPMHDALGRVVLDLGGRADLWFAPERAHAVGAFSTHSATEFLRSLAEHGRLNAHVDILRGSDPHHALEAVFKALGRALREAVAPDPRQTGPPSTKGTLSAGNAPAA
jgi:imidazoleglycerol-phosphate dehydratase